MLKNAFITTLPMWSRMPIRRELNGMRFVNSCIVIPLYFANSTLLRRASFTNIRPKFLWFHYGYIYTQISRIQDIQSCNRRYARSCLSFKAELLCQVSTYNEYLVEPNTNNTTEGICQWINHTFVRVTQFLAFTLQRRFFMVIHNTLRYKNSHKKFWFRHNLYVYLCIVKHLAFVNMKKQLITLTISLMVLGGIALHFQSNSNSSTPTGMQDTIAMSTQAPDVCYRCKGSGKCVACKGRGSITGAVKRKCSDCNGTGVCQRCKGTGKDPVWKK